MVRTQIYITEKERQGLTTLSEKTGKKQSELIRQAVDRMIEQSSRSRRETILRTAAGMWRDHRDIPDPVLIRADWDRK